MSLAKLGIPLTLSPMEALLAADLPQDAEGQFEPKWDAFRCLAFRAGSEVEIRAKSGKSLSRFFPEVLANLRGLSHATFVLDGELVIPFGGELSFDALQMRLHPAQSPINRLAEETPAKLIVFDCLLTKTGQSLLDRPFAKRREALEVLFARVGKARGLALTPYTRDVRKASQWLEARQDSLDGVVAKRLDLPYRAGERAMLKIKRRRTIDCVVGGFRYESSARQVGSLLLGLYDKTGLLHHVGFTTLAAPDKPALTKRLEKLIAAPGFTGNAPGAPSRWSTDRSAEWEPLTPELVVEVEYDHLTAIAFATERSLCAGGRTRSRGNAPSRSCRAPRAPCSAELMAHFA